MHARLFLAWLAIAIIAVAGQSGESYEDEIEESDGVPLKVRSALAKEALDVMHEHGEDVDISLDGYDHDLIAGDLRDDPATEGLEARDAGLDSEALRKLARMKPHYVQHQARDEEEDDEEDEEDDDTPYVDLDPEDENEDEDADVTFANIVPDPAGDDDELAQPPIEARDVEDADDDEDSEEVFGDDLDEDNEPGNYNSELYARDFDPEDGEENIDYSLEDYDPALLRRRQDGANDDFDEDNFDFHSFLSESPDSPASASGSRISERDIAADADESFEGPADEWYNSGRRNARYLDEGPEQERKVFLGRPLQFKRDIVEESFSGDEEPEGAFSRAWSQFRRWAEDVLT